MKKKTQSKMEQESNNTRAKAKEDEHITGHFSVKKKISPNPNPNQLFICFFFFLPGKKKKKKKRGCRRKMKNSNVQQLERQFKFLLSNENIIARPPPNFPFHPTGNLEAHVGFSQIAVFPTRHYHQTKQGEQTNTELWKTTRPQRNNNNNNPAMASGSRANNNSNQLAQSSNTTSNMKLHHAESSIPRAIEQYTVDARLHAVFEQSGESGKSFDYSQSVRTATQSVPEQQITAYLSRIQRGGHIQPFGCMIAVEEGTCRVIAYSENAREMLGLLPQSVPSLERPEILTIGIDVRTLFTPSSSVLLEKAFGAREITLLNPVWIHSKNSGNPFYAILHRIDVGIVIDLEPARTEDPALSIAGAVQSQKLAVRAISQLQSLPGGDIKLLCDTVVESVRELTGYDRVMVYKFHEDEHGEVVAESKRPDLEPYIGLHYPATDIPQASRFLFKQNRVRMIVDCHATSVRVIQDERLMQPLCLVGSTLRAPHGCHAQYMANMGSNASLAMAVVINGNDEEAVGVRNVMRLWGLVVCHHTSARCIPFPLRYACEFLMQAFGLQLNMELQLASQLLEKHVLRTQTLLCDMLLRDSPTGIVTQSPSIMDLVKCDGAALYYQGKYYPMGVTPTEAQIKDIVEWLLAFHGDSTGLSTDSLADAGYPGAASLGDAVCGLAVAYITKRDFLFWFRSHTGKEIKWGGAKHHPQDKDDGQRMHPRSSFKAFLEVVKSRSLPWENAEMDAIHSLQLILRDSFRDAEASNSKAVIHAELGGLELQGMDELGAVAREMVRLIETATAPIFAVDVDGCINGWNAKVAELTGLSVDEAMGKSLVHDLVYKESEETVDKLLYHALRGSLFTSNVFLPANSRNSIRGCIGILLKCFVPVHFVLHKENPAN